MKMKTNTKKLKTTPTTSAQKRTTTPTTTAAAKVMCICGQRLFKVPNTSQLWICDDDDDDGSKLLMSPNTALTAESSIVTPLMSPSVGKPKTKQEISAQIDRIQSDIVENEQEMQTLQTAINEAVANEDYESAGQMAPKKKRLTAQGKALKDKLQRREQEFADAVDEDEDEDDEEEKEPETQEEEEQVEEATVVHDNAHAQEQEQKTEDSDAVHVNTINADAESNTGYNGGGAITIDSNGDNSEQASNEDEERPETIAQEIDVVQQLETDMIPKNVAETNSGSVSDQISNDEVEQNGINIADKHQDDDDNNDMFGDMDMDVAVAEEDTVNID
uniref:Uncharacterized protein n=1 Tax=Elphidium margaritaceum TaxID=933848 RepID=A0A7S0TBB3_9EUKA